MKRFEKLQKAFLLSTLLASSLIFSLCYLLEVHKDENTKLREQLAQVRYFEDAERNHHNNELEQAWDEHAQCKRDFVAQFKAVACQSPHDVCGRALDIYCVEGRPTVRATADMCKAWGRHFLTRESTGGS